MGDIKHPTGGKRSKHTGKVRYRDIVKNTVCLYHGKKAWDGPRSLKDMMDFGSDTAEAIAVVLGWSDPKEIPMKYEEKGKGREAWY